MRNAHTTVRMRWWLAPVFAGMLALGGCSLLGGGGGTGGVSPADATVTAIVTQTYGQSNCQPQLQYLLDNQQRLGTLGKSTIMFEGTCWLAGRTVSISIINHTNDSKGITEPTITPLLNTNGSPVTITVGADGTFRLSMPLTSAMAQYVWDSRLPFVAQVDGFVQFAATSVQITSS